MSNETGLGVQTLLRGRTSADYPFSFAETPSGLLLLANGIDPMLKWDGLAQSSTAAGVKSPIAAIELGGVGLGSITGKIVAYQRFLDAMGNPSNVSPVSNLVDCGTSGFVQDVSYRPSSGLVTLKSPEHGLVTGDAIIVTDVTGLALLNGQWLVTVVDGDNFTVNGLSISSGYYSGGGEWTMGVLNVLYGSVPIPTEANVARRQILRNLSGTLDTLYVDIDTTDLIATAFSSYTDDPTLAQGISVPMTYGDDDLPYANRNAPPPNHKTVVASHKGRIYATCDAVYRDGHAEVNFAGVTVQGVGTDWRETFVGRQIYFAGALTPYGITAVNETNQTLTLDKPFMDTPKPYFLYVIRPEPGERRLVYYSEPGLAESWPEYNALAVPETNDEIVGLNSLGQYLYIFERRHIHRLTFQGDPQDGYTFLSATRGSINNRTYVTADNVTYCLDEIGIHKFDGQDSTPISLPIQNLFQTDGYSELEVDWNADQTLWHAAHDPVRDTIRWFVSMVGIADLTYCICFNYRTDRWWIEQYPTPVTASTNATFGARRSLVGTDARRVLCLSEGNWDGVNDSGTLRGSPTGANSTSITDTSASFNAVESAPITIVEGTGRGQTRIIASADTTSVTVVLPWDVVPDATSIYQIGGVNWFWRSGWFRFVDHEEDLARDVEIVFRPTTTDTTLDFQLYFDQDVNPRLWSRSIDQDGVRTVEGEQYIRVDLKTSTGWARQRITGHGGTYSFADTFIAVEMSGVQAGSPVRVSQVVINDVEQD